MAIAEMKREALPADEFIAELDAIRREFLQGRTLRSRPHYTTKDEVAEAKRKRHRGGPIHNHKYVGLKYLNCEDKELRRLNLRKLIDECGQQTVGVGLPSHPVLLRWGSHAFGISDEEIDQLEKEDLPPDVLLWTAMKIYLHRTSHWAIGIAMSYVGEGEKLHPEIQKKLWDQIDQTKAEYVAMGIDDLDKALAFETEHAGVDVEHAEIAVKAIREFITTPELQDEMRRAFILTLQQRGY
jgi:pyrroloquinoline quinone (PQQ) biosynthesis protein C